MAPRNPTGDGAEQLPRRAIVELRERQARGELRVRLAEEFRNLVAELGLAEA